MRSQPVSQRRRRWLLALVVVVWFAALLWNRLLGTFSLLPLAMYLVWPRGSLRDHVLGGLRSARNKQTERRRRRRLRSAGALRQYHYAELRKLAVHVDNHTRSDIEALLERFVTLSLAHEQLVDSLAAAIATDVRLSGDVTGALADDPRMCARVRDIRACRRQHRHAMREYADRVAEELDAIVDLVYLLVARAVVPTEDGLQVGDEVSRRLSLLDHTDAAMAMLAAPASMEYLRSPVAATEPA